MQMRDCDHPHAARADRVEEAVREATKEETSQLAIGNWIRGRVFTDRSDGTLDLTLERRRGTRTVFAVPENSCAGFLLRTRIELDG
jgi:hypothetical protein